MIYRVKNASDYWFIKCPATGGIMIPKDGRWKFNGDYEHPTFSPSFNETCGKPGQTTEEFLADPNPSRNHLFITNGQIEYLSDCTHAYAGKTVDIEPLTEVEVQIYFPNG